MSEIDRAYNGSKRGMQRLSGGYSSWRWLGGINAKERMWFLGALHRRNGYEAWSVHLADGLQNTDFLLRFEATSDPWERSKLVGQRISELRKTFLKMPEAQKAELARRGEVELKTGLELMGKDKRTIQELISLVDPPTH
jgi:hypothetical protein